MTVEAEWAQARAELSRLARIDEYDLLPTVLADQRPLLLPPPAPDDELRHELGGLTELARRITGAAVARVNIITAEDQYTLALPGFDGMVCDRNDSFCSMVIDGSETVVVPDARADRRFADKPFVTGAYDLIRFYAASPLVTPGGLVIGTLCVADREVLELGPSQVSALGTLAAQTVDVLELHRRTRQLDDAVAALVRSNTALAEFAGRVSHDLQAPLNSIIGFAEILGAGPDLPVTEAELYLDRIQAAGNRMQAMIRDLLGYARAGATLAPVPVDLRPLAEEVIRDLDRAVRASGARFTVDVGVVTGDAPQLRALLQNLLTNAMKYRRPDRPALIEIRTRANLDGWLLQVDDNGLGIPPADRSRVLQPLTRLERDRKLPGTGVGLATVARIAQAHDAQLRLAESPSGGLRVTLHVPFA